MKPLTFISIWLTIISAGMIAVGLANVGGPADYVLLVVYGALLMLVAIGAGIYSTTNN